MKKIIPVIVTFSMIHSVDALAREYSFDYKYFDEKKFNIFNYNLNDTGNYIVNSYVNNEFIGVEEIFFKNVNNKSTPCLTKEHLLNYGIIVSKFDRNVFDDEFCYVFDGNIKYNYDSGTQTLKLSVDNYVLKSKDNDIEDASLWDDGINAVLLNYRSSYLNANDSTKEQFSGQFEPGLNIGPWRLRNLTSWKKDSKQNKIETAYTYIERGLPSVKGKLTIGDKTTESDAFDSIPFRGVAIKSDENMTPYSIRHYMPVITGIAKTQAEVEVRQNGYLLYTTIVAPGPFEIKDSSLSNVVGGSYDVKIIESNGEIQTYSVPYSEPFFALAEGYFRYSLTAGDYRSSDDHVESKSFIEGSASYGFPWGISAFSGLQIADIYKSMSLGLSKDFGSIGAGSVDWKISKSKSEKDYQHGDAFGLKYNKSIDNSSTDINVANYYYSKEYRTLSEIFDTYSNGGYIVQTPRKSNFTLGVNQGLGNFGYLYFGFYRDNFWNGNDQNSISSRYNKNIGNTSLSLVYTKSRVENKYKFKDENIFSIWLSVPLGDRANNSVYANYQFASSDDRYATHEVGLTGSGFEQRLNWEIRERIKETHSEKTDTYVSGSWRGTYGQVGINYSYNNVHRNIGANLSGGVVIHDQGITLGQRLANTTALVEAKDVEGVRILTLPGTYTDYKGYTVTGMLSPYKKNTISVSPETIPEDSDIRQTDVKVIPSDGAIVKAKFFANKGANVLMEIKKKDGKYLPLGAIISVKDEGNVVKSTFIVGDNGNTYLSGLKKQGVLYAVWGANANEKCEIPYNIQHAKKTKNVFIMKGECR
ncbi:fimbria/pilus outer membrane usher protein [Klebsiella pneumoniae]|uniref:Fimbria/pilus outer membrane usher protein n=1 Tax=Klebsiella pneumoniae TaxID=573 RepID=A0AAW8AMJ5_KLEPN|nr:fimbria/pilus outer membrane usher protein [Klebsiella pneumoniae]MBC0707499.1 fimbria/pilus outer membrane usher protein [Escherichia coli]EIV7913468.1 fimbria/pilus outer membrane usher protein [Klebsiella pneumoniae]EIW3892838.1 fimbria/pilus outer membrane usher protein [Klebsiella pneumoniae]MBA8411563.1 fimbria/pilus outer membrane usher protein [Klebsiella pneumoniae]MCG5620664.1 fimbria/pilus outer membrane usher protein [Klebsiella pneumoniae]